MRRPHPRAALALLFALSITACDGGGGGDADGGGSPDDAAMGPEDAAMGSEDAAVPPSGPTLYVINNSDDLTSYVGIDSLSGDVAPSTSLTVGAATGLTQPRSVVVTASGRLIVGRQSGGFAIWQDASAADGDVAADDTVEGAATLVSNPIALEYDPAADRLYVGTPNAAEGILVFDDVSGASFTGELAPSRTFGPSDRVPHTTTGTIEMTVDALALVDGALYVADTSGTDVNHSRVLVFDAPATADGLTEPTRTIRSTAWEGLTSITVRAGALYAVDESDVVYVVEDIATADGDVTPVPVTVSGDRVQLSAILSTQGGALYLLDRNNASILAFDAGIDAGAGAAAPDRVVGGSSTGLRTPLELFLVD